jgi:dimethylargininase
VDPPDITYSHTFSHAIVRAASPRFVDGLRADDRGVPDFARFQEHHAAYIAALASTGATVIQLDRLDDYPDSIFVEDTALCLPEGAIMLRPGAPSRLGESAAMAPALAGFYSELITLEGPGFIEGGDILVIAREILVGRSARTDTDGIAELREHVAGWGYSLREVETPPGVLHFKTDCSLLDETTILATPKLAATGCFEQYRLIMTAEGEDAAANTIRFNQLVLMPAGFPGTANRLVTSGYNVREIGNSEAAKLDGGMSCLSLRFTPAP